MNAGYYSEQSVKDLLAVKDGTIQFLSKENQHLKNQLEHLQKRVEKLESRSVAIVY